MLISPIIKDTELYIHLHAEQSVTGTFYSDNDEPKENIITGIYTKELSQTTLKAIIKYLEQYKDKAYNIVFDFSDLDDVNKNVTEEIVKIRKKANFLIFLNVSEYIIKKMTLTTFSDNEVNQSQLENNNYEIFYVTDIACKVIPSSLTTIFEKEFETNLEKITKERDIEEQKHFSSSVYLPKFIDIKSLAVNSQQFFIYTIYRLAKKIERNTSLNLEIGKSNDTILFCQNLNNSYISSVLSSFLLIDVIVMDRIGPINKVYHELGKKIKRNAKYIVVSDVVCMGTEVRIAKNIIEFLGGKYLGNVSIVRIATLKKEDKYLDTESIFELTKENNSKIGFEIKTALID